MDNALRVSDEVKELVSAFLVLILVLMENALRVLLWWKRNTNELES